MFGGFRLYLAVAVMAFHLMGVPAIGEGAVASFFVLSGFLMTMIMTETYGYTAKGMGAFAMNRWLRLYPAYWVAIALSVGVILITGEQFSAAFNEVLILPHNPGAWLGNATMIFPDIIPFRVSPRLSPAAWALTVELFYYVLIGLGATRTLFRSSLLLMAGIAYHAWQFAVGAPYEYHYFAIPAGAVPFAMGGLAYHLRATLYARSALSAIQWIAIHVAVMLIAMLVQHSWKSTQTCVLSLAAIILVSVPAVIRLQRDNLPLLSPGIDTLLGKFSYPFYLVHWQMGLLTACFILGRPDHRANTATIAVFPVTLLLTILASFVIIKLIDPGVDRLRRRIKLGVAQDLWAPTPNAASA